MGTIYRVHEGYPRLQYYNNNLDYYTSSNAMPLHLKSSQNTPKIKLIYLYRAIKNVVEAYKS
jgi:hypothetical protein